MSGSGFTAFRTKYSNYSRGTLNNFDPANLVKEKRIAFYNILIESICSDVDKILVDNNGSLKQFVCKNIRCVKYAPRWQPGQRMPYSFWHYERTEALRETLKPDPEAEKYLPEFISLLQETFVDCKLTIDPLKTYLIIDWS